MAEDKKRSKGQNTESVLKFETPQNHNSFIKFYGLYWKKDFINSDNPSDIQILGQPKGWLGKGKVAPTTDRSLFQMNFAGQRGVYILYNSDLIPVYAGQAGITRSNTNVGQTIGDRLNFHKRGVYRNGWSMFSWFGFLTSEKLDLRSNSVTKENRMTPFWSFPASKNGDDSNNNNLNLILASFEAILIEGFAPRFNARGGDLKEAVYVNQFEPSSSDAAASPPHVPVAQNLRKPR